MPFICWLPQLIIDHLKNKIVPKNSTENLGRIFCWVCILVTFIFFSFAQTKLPNYIYLIFPFLSILISEWLIRKKSNARAILLPLLIFSFTLIVIGASMKIYDIDANSQFLIKLTFIFITLPGIAFIIGIIQKRSMKWIMLGFTAISFVSMTWLTFVIFPKVSKFDDIKKAASVIKEDSKNQDYEMVHFYGMQPSLLVRLDRNAKQTRSIKTVEEKLNTHNLVYILAKQEHEESLNQMTKEASAKWYVGKSLVLKFKQ